MLNYGLYCNQKIKKTINFKLKVLRNYILKLRITVIDLSYFVVHLLLDF